MAGIAVRSGLGVHRSRAMGRNELGDDRELRNGKETK